MTGFFEKGREYLGNSYPIMCGAMTWVCDPKRASAVSIAGGLGLLAGDNMPMELLRDQKLQRLHRIFEDED